MITYSQFVKENSKELAESKVQENPCTFCSLKDNGICYKASGVGSTKPVFMVVADFMRKNWFTSCTPFSGQIVPLLQDLFKKVNINISECYFTSLVKCASSKSLRGGKETAPKKEVIDYCSRYLDREVKEKCPKVVIACGQTALEFFFPKAKLSEKRCQALYSDTYKCYVIPIYNPEAMTSTYEFDDLIQKAFEQAYNAAYNPDKLKFPQTKYVNVTDINLLRQIGERVKQVDRFAYDLETNSVTYTKAKILSVGISWAKNTGVAWPLWVKDDDACNKMLEGLEGSERTKMATKLDHDPILKKFWKDEEWDEVIKITKDIFENTDCKKGGHNTFFDNLVLHFNGISVKNYCYDTMIMKHLLDEESEKSLDYCSWIYTDKGGYKMEKEEYLKSDKSNFANIPLDVLLKYNAGDAAVTYELYDVFKPMLVEQNLCYEMGNIRIPLQKALMEACIYGMRVDKEYLRETGEKLTKEIKEIEDKILPILQKYYGMDVVIVSEKSDSKSANEFNINSAQCLRDLLFNKMKLKSSGKTTSGEDSTNESSLLKLARKGVEIADLILKRKKKFKFKTTYIDGMEELLDENDRVHPSFNVCGTESGRLSCSNPNLQQIPRDKTIKNIFKAPEGYEIGECDFSQAELRVMAALANDITMKRIYDQGRDLHLELASTAFKKPAEDITKEERTIAKTCFSADSMILTDKGYVRARDLGDSMVMTLDGKPQHQKHIFEKQNGYEIELSNGNIIRVTTNHRFKVFDKINPYWKTASELKCGDILGTVKVCSFGDYKSFKIGEGLRTKTYNTDFTLDESLAYTLGLYLSDGSVSYSKNSGSFQVLIKPQNREVVLRSLEKFGVSEYKYYSKPYSRAVVSTKAFCDWVVEHFGSGSNKHISDVIYTCPKSVALSFLSGLLDSDSYITKRVRFINTNEQLSRDVAKLGSLLGYEIKFGCKNYSTKIKEKQYSGVLYSVTFVSKPNINLLVKKHYFDTRVSEVYDKSGWVIDVNEFKNNIWNGKSNYLIKNYRGGKSNIISVGASKKLGLIHSNYNPVTIVSIKECEIDTLIMETDTHYFIGEGFESHNCNFLIGYAGGPDTLKANLSDGGVEISLKDAEKIINTWHHKFMDASTFLMTSNKRFIRDGILVTPFGRRRRMKRQFADDYLNQKKGREGQNFIIQGTAAELAFISLINIARDIKQFGGHVISTVHDSILIEYPKEQRKNIANICKKHTWITFPFLNGMYMKSDMEVAESWGNKKPINLDTGEYEEE